MQPQYSDDYRDGYKRAMSELGRQISRLAYSDPVAPRTIPEPGRLGLIMLLREATGMGLGEAKEWMEAFIRKEIGNV